MIEITLASPEHTDAETERQPQVAVKHEPEVPDTLLYPKILRRGGFSGNSSTGCDESCGAYLARKFEELEKATEHDSAPESTSKNKQSESEPLTIHPTCGTAVAEGADTLTKLGPTGPVHSLSSTKFLNANTSTSGITDNTEEITPSYEFAFPPALEHRSIRGVLACRRNDTTSFKNLRPTQSEVISDSEMEMPPLSDQDSARYVRSTLAEALAPPKNWTIACSSGESDYESSVKAPKDTVRETSVSITSRKVIRRYFAETNLYVYHRCNPQ